MHRRFTSSLIVGAALLAAGLYLWGDRNPDWLGYESMYDSGGAWLSDFGRDPLFVALVSSAAELLGRHGYETFRLVVLVVFAVLAAAIALTLPGHPLVVVAAVVAMLLTKATIQVREGLAFILVALAVVRIVRRQATLLAYGLLLAAALTHIGAAPYLLLGALTHRPPPRRLLLIVAIVAAIAAGNSAEHFLSSADDALAHFGLGRSFDEASVWRFVYWGVYGGILLMLARALTQDGQRFGVVLAWGLIPFLYAVAVYLLVTAQPLPVVALASRALATAAAVAILVLLLRSRSPLVVFCASAFLLIDQARTIYVAVSLL